MRGATLTGVGFHDSTCISTHTPHAGRDIWVFIVNVIHQYFYSHAPCGARPKHAANVLESIVFLLTRPMRGATYCICNTIYIRSISTHTPHAGRDIFLEIPTEI